MHAALMLSPALINGTSPSSSNNSMPPSPQLELVGNTPQINVYQKKINFDIEAGESGHRRHHRQLFQTEEGGSITEPIVAVRGRHGVQYVAR